MKYKIDNIREMYKNGLLDINLVTELRNDKRKGIQKIIESYDRNVLKQQKLYERFLKLRNFDRSHTNSVDDIIVGVDEVGRGPLAGPVICCAVILKRNFDVIEVFDSKKLSKGKRDSLIDEIKRNIIDYSVSLVDTQEIDKLNIYQASKKGMLEAINSLNIIPDIILSDAMELNIDNIKNISLIKGDMKSLSIATASIIAKDIRDNLMIEYDEKYPQYDFKNNFGYGTKKHLLALKKFGECKIHRQSFEPIKSKKY